MSSDESGSDQEPMEVGLIFFKRIQNRFIDQEYSFYKNFLFHLQTDEVETKKDQKLEIRERYKGNDNRRIQRHDGGKDKKDRSLDPMDPASYSDIPRFLLIIILGAASYLILLFQKLEYNG